MKAFEKRTEIKHLLRNEFDRESASDFALLRRIQSTDTRKFLDYFSTLDKVRKAALADGLAERSLLTFFPDRTLHPYQAGHVAFKQYLDSLPLMWNLRYEDVRMLRKRLAVAKLEPESREGKWMTDDVKRWIENIKPVKSTEIRRAVKLALSQIIISMTATHDGQYWLYEGEFKNKVISVTIDYSHKYYQLDYWVSTQDNQRGIMGLNYERLMGLASAQWDCLEQTNLDQSVALLKELVSHCATFLQSIHA